MKPITTQFYKSLFMNECKRIENKEISLFNFHSINFFMNNDLNR